MLRQYACNNNAVVPSDAADGVLSMQSEAVANAEAERVLSEELPDPIERTIVLRRLLESADAANAIAADAWAVTLFRNGFRLNVGQVETVRFFDGVLYINLVGSPGAGALVGISFVTTKGYRSLPQPVCMFAGTPQCYSGLAPVMHDAHEQFIQLAATTSSGHPRKGTPFRASHHEGLIEYARQFCSTQSAPGKEPEPSVSADDIDLMTSASEGSPRLVAHLRRERNRALIAAKKAAVMNAKSCLACEACGFDFSLAYGTCGKDYCEVHHRIPLSTSDAAVLTTLDDLAILCSNCHRIIHLSPMLSVEALAEVVRGQLDNRESHV